MKNQLSFFIFRDEMKTMKWQRVAIQVERRYSSAASAAPFETTAIPQPQSIIQHENDVVTSVVLHVSQQVVPEVLTVIVCTGFLRGLRYLS